MNNKGEGISSLLLGFFFFFSFRSNNLEQIPDALEETETASLSSSHSEWRNLGNFLRVALPSHQSTVIPLQAEMTVWDVVENTCNKRQLDPLQHFLKLGIEDNTGKIGRGFLS